MRSLRRIRQEFLEDVVVIGVHSAKFTAERQIENIHQAVQRLGIEHPVVNDADFKIWSAYAIRAWPTVVLIGPQGRVEREQSGEIDPDEWILDIETLLREYRSQGVLTDQTARISAPLQPQRSGRLHFPSRVLALPGGRLFVADTGNHRILELRFPADSGSGEALIAGVERIFGTGEAGFEDGPSEAARFTQPRGLSVEGNDLFVADTGNHAIRHIELASGQISTLAGNGKKGEGLYQPTTPTETPLRSPWALLSLREENRHYLFIAMAGSHQIWLLINREKLGVLAGNGREALVDGHPAEASFNQPSDLVLAWNYLMVADAEASAIRAIALDVDPKVFTLVGQGLFEFGDVDGSGAEVRLQHPTGLAWSGDLAFIADTYNNKIKTLDPSSGEVRSLIGTGEPGAADGDFATASLFEPEGVGYLDGKLFIADTNNHAIRLADLTTRRVQTLRISGLE